MYDTTEAGSPWPASNDRGVRRTSLLAAAGMAAAASEAEAAAAGLPDKAEFPVVKSEFCLNNARWRPIGFGAAPTFQRYLHYKASGGAFAATTPTNCRIMPQSNSPRIRPGLTDFPAKFAFK